MVPLRGWPSASLMLATAILAYSCAAIHHPPTTIAALEAARTEWAAAEQATVGGLVDGLVRRVTVHGETTLNLLFLSGGGQDGAYGAGFLRGWQSRSDDPLPTFDLVSGVSAGAIEAPFAFVGTSASLDEGSTLFRHAARSYAPTFDWWFWLRRTGGITNVSRFRKIIDKVIAPDLQTKLQPGFTDDRHLVMSTTDFDLGVGHVWDLAHELASQADGLRRARTILLASTALPSVFPPVILDGHVHADGGVISNVCVPLGLEDYRHLSDALQAVGFTGRVTIRIWVVLNLFASPVVHITNPASRGGMLSRASTLVFAAAEDQILGTLADLAHAVDGMPGLRMEVRATAIPSAMAAEPGAQKFFDEKWMNRLEAFGYDRARGDHPWEDIATETPPGSRH